MKITINSVNGYLDDKYSKYAEEENYYNGNPFVSFPIKIEGIPQGAKTLALTFIDHDAIPVCGFSWIHWVACNIPVDIEELPENLSHNNGLGIVQGQNSFASPFIGVTDKKTIHRYVGPTPPNADHDYTLTVYALDSELDLEEGFLLNDFYKKADKRILDISNTIVKAKK